MKEEKAVWLRETRVHPSRALTAPDSRPDHRLWRV